MYRRRRLEDMAKIYDATTGKIIDKGTGAEVTMPSSSI